MAMSNLADGVTRVLDERRQSDRFSVSALPDVKDPEAAFANLTREQYEDYIKDFDKFETDLIAKTKDTSIIDQSRKDTERQTQISKEIQQRNRERYGGAGLTNAQKSEQARASQRGGALTYADNVNNAREKQSDVNNALLRELVGVGQGVNANALSGLGNASSLAAQRAAAYKNSKASYSNSMVGLGATLATAAFFL